MEIVELELATTKLSILREFYHHGLQLPLLEATAERIALQIGTSRLVFRATDQVDGVYHFAINIPENQLSDAERWLCLRAPLLSDTCGRSQFHSAAWDADMIYFADPAGNILELIARHTLPSVSQQPFSSHSLLAISEIGIAADDVASQVASVQARCAAAVYRGSGSPTFTAVGDEQGLFIVVQRGRMWFPETGKPAEHLPLRIVTGAPETSIQWQFPA